MDEEQLNRLIPMSSIKEEEEFKRFTVEAGLAR
jgi:hypothetical protein